MFLLCRPGYPCWWGQRKQQKNGRNGTLFYFYFCGLCGQMFWNKLHYAGHTDIQTNTQITQIFLGILFLSFQKYLVTGYACYSNFNLSKSMYITTHQNQSILFPSLSTTKPTLVCVKFLNFPTIQLVLLRIHIITVLLSIHTQYYTVLVHTLQYNANHRKIILYSAK